MFYQIKTTQIMTTATQILQQLGGRKFIAMTGATCYGDGNTLTVKFKGSKVANIMDVTLEENDLYSVHICKFRGMDMKTVKKETGVYCDMLTPMFEQVTGLRTSL